MPPPPTLTRLSLILTVTAPAAPAGGYTVELEFKGPLPAPSQLTADALRQRLCLNSSFDGGEIVARFQDGEGVMLMQSPAGASAMRVRLLEVADVSLSVGVGVRLEGSALGRAAP